MMSISELRLVKGVTPEIYASLAPYLTALPKATPINVNSASPEILQAFSPTLSATSAKVIADTARKTPFPSIDKFQSFELVKNNPFEAGKIWLAGVPEIPVW